MNSHLDSVGRASDGHFITLDHHHSTNEIYLIYTVMPSECPPIKLNVWDILSRSVRYYKSSILSEWLDCLQYVPFEPFWQYMTRILPLMVSNISIYIYICD